jgi:hypothetical protein
MVWSVPYRSLPLVTLDCDQDHKLPYHEAQKNLDKPYTVLVIKATTMSSKAGPASCKACGSINQKKFIGEMGIRTPGLKGLEKPIVWVFPELVVCLDCGMAEFTAPEAELRVLAKGEAAAAG